MNVSRRHTFYKLVTKCRSFRSYLEDLATSEKASVLNFLQSSTPQVCSCELIDTIVLPMANIKEITLTFNERPLGFSVIRDKDGLNAVVSSIQREHLYDLGLLPGQYVFALNDQCVENWKHRQIYRAVVSADFPLHITFRESECDTPVIMHYKKKMARYQKSLFLLTQDRWKFIMSAAVEIDNLRKHLCGRAPHSRQSIEYESPSTDWIYKVKYRSIFATFDQDVCRLMVFGYLRESEMMIGRIIPLDIFGLCLRMLGHGPQEYLLKIEELKSMEQYLLDSKLRLIGSIESQIRTLRELLKKQHLRNVQGLQANVSVNS